MAFRKNIFLNFLFHSDIHNCNPCIFNACTIKVITIKFLMNMFNTNFISFRLATSAIDMSKIILCGASSVGKTTLSNDWCKSNIRYTQIQEVARDVMTKLKITRCDMEHSLRTDKRLFFDLQKSIFVEQNKREALLADTPFISDRGPDPLVYSFLEDEEEAMTLSGHTAVKQCFDLYRKCLVVVVCPLDNTVDDGVRLVQSNEEQHKFTDGLHRVLREYKVPYMTLVEKDREERVKILKSAVQGQVPISADQFKAQLCLTFYMERNSAKNDTFCPPVLPMSRQGKEARVRTFDINPNEMLLTRPPMDNFQTNRMVDRYGEDSFILLQFHNKLSEEYIREVLQQAILVNGEEYRFLGCSSSGLKSKKCYLFKGDVERVETVLSECGNFNKINMVSKRLKRIGLLFSVAINTGVVVPDDKVEVIDDIETKGGNFTDGCGFVGMELAKRLAKGANARINSPEDNVPSVFQIRFKGFKGILIKSPDIDKNSIQARKSMKKFESGTVPFQEVWVCKHSRPNLYGHLNKQYIVLLSGLGIKDEVFLKKQGEFFVAVESMLVKRDYAIKLLNSQNYPDLATSVAACKSNEDMKENSSVQSTLKYIRTKLISKMEKLSIPVIKSRTLFGVCDPYKLMNYGECFVRVSINGSPKTIEQGTSVTVGKNPCYLLGDVRVLKAVDYPALNHLVDCIVFPVRGIRPHSTEIAGSDLDGDEYFVCWDAALIPPRIFSPYAYPSIDAPPSDTVTRTMMIDYFSSLRDMMGKISNYFQHWADTIGPGCKECEELGAWFSRSVDSSKTGDKVRIPNYLRPPPPNPDAPPPQEVAKKVWVEMERLACERKQKLSEDVTEEALTDESSISAITEEFITDLLLDQDRGISEYKVFCLLYKWCDAQQLTNIDKLEKLRALSDHINFGKLTMKERLEAIQLGISRAKVMNALNKSRLLNKQMLESFYLDIPSCGWKFYLRESSADFDWRHLFRAIKGYPESLLILQIHDEHIQYTLGFHFLGPFKEGESIIPAGALTAYFFSPKFGYKLRYVIECKYNLNLTDQVIQFYRNNDVKNTFLWLRSQIESKKGVDYDRISIDLNRFKRTILRVDRHPKINKMNFKTVEVFVKNFSLEETAYFDVRESDQPDDLFTSEADNSELLEELPSDEEDDKKEIVLTTVTDTPIEALEKVAKRGDYIKFIEVIESISGSEDNEERFLIEEFLSLLSNLVIKYAHIGKPTEASGEVITEEWPKLQTTTLNIQAGVAKARPEDNKQNNITWTQPLPDTQEINTIQIDKIQTATTNLETTRVNKAKNIREGIISILNSSLINFTVARDVLDLYSYLSKLHLYDIIKQHIDQSIDKIKISTRDHYFGCIFNWESWCFLPLSISCQLSNRLYTLYLSLDSVKGSDKSGITIPISLKELSITDNDPPPVDQTQLYQYMCYFAHLMLNHLLAESPGHKEYDKIRDTDNSVCMLRVLPSKRETPANTDLSSSSDEETKDTTAVVKVKRKKKNKNENWEACFSRLNQVTSSKFAKGSYVKIRFLPTSTSAHSSEPIALGRISQYSWSPASITVDILKPVPSCLRRSAELKKGLWALTLLGNITSFKRSSKALQNLHSSVMAPILISPDAFPPQVLPQENELDSSEQIPEPVSEPGQRHNPHNSFQECRACEDRPNFNQSQENAIFTAISQRLTLIHGPPGTGKTFVAAEIVHQMCHMDKDQNFKILVAAETNNAVDNLTRKLVNLGLLVVRVGKRNTISKDLHEYSLDYQVEMKRVEVGQSKKGEFQSPKLKKEILNAADIIATTCTGAGDSDLKTIKFPYILIDEATQAIEPVSLISIAKYCERLILIGDPKQLAPTLPDQRALEEQPLEGTPPCDALRVTLFHRLCLKLDPIFLNEQHRMHPVIAEFPSMMFYAAKLRTAVKKEDRTPPNVPFLSSKRPVIFFNSESPEFRAGTSWKNPGEADIVVDIIKQLVATSECPVTNIGVITPYTGQVKCIKDKLDMKVEVNSIDGFQGKEKEIIVFSTVRNTASSELAFIKDHHRINVLLTRAKRGLIGVGNQNTLSMSDVWDKWTKMYKASDILSGSYDTEQKSKEDSVREKPLDKSTPKPNVHRTPVKDSFSNNRPDDNKYNSPRERDRTIEQYKHSGRGSTLLDLTPKKKVSQKKRKYGGAGKSTDNGETHREKN